MRDAIRLNRRVHEAPIYGALLFPGHIKPLDEDDHGETVLRVDPERSTTRAAVAEAPDARPFVVADLDREADAVRFLRIDGDVAGLDGGHLPHGVLRKVAVPVELAAAQQ